MFKGLKEDLAKYLDEKLDITNNRLNRIYYDISKDLSVRHEAVKNILADQHRSIEVLIGNDRAETDEKLNSLYRELHKIKGHNAEIAAGMEMIARAAGDKDDYIAELQDTIKSQQNTIERLSNALCNKYLKGLFIMTDVDCRKPVAIRDGELVDLSHATDLTISWSEHDAPVISINQEIIC